MKKAIAAAIAALLLLTAPTTARAPTKPQEIHGFRPVEISTVPTVVDWFPTSTDLPPRPQIIIGTAPIITNLTPPTAVVHTVNEAKSYALAVLGAVQYSCIDKIFTQESNWRTKALNSTTGAYGIPQALPGSKMATIASDWRVNPVTQVKWGIKYVNGRYGSACVAWRFKQIHGWY